MRTLSAALALALMGFGQPAAAKYPGAIGDVTNAKAGEVLVLGTVRFVRNGKIKKCSVSARECILIIVREGSTKAVTYAFKSDDPFAWSLPPGHYTILAYEISYPGTTTVPLDAEFTVPEGAKAIYVGDLLLLMQDNAHREGLFDRFDEASARYRAAHPAEMSTLTKALLERSATTAPTGPVARAAYICESEWGVTCTDTLKGVTPTSPAEIKGFAPVSSLTPELAWQPASVPGVTYDIALFEAVSYSGIRAGNLPGRIVAYRESLSHPSWRPDEPLKPGRRYYWSVRLRKGDTISNWSTRSHFSFFLIGFSSGSGDFFNFSTPATAPGK